MELTRELERLEDDIAELTPATCRELTAEYDRWGDVASSALGTLSATLLRALGPVTPRLQAAVAASLGDEVDAEQHERVAMAAWIYLLAVLDDGDHPMASLLREPWEEHRRRQARPHRGPVPTL